MKRLIILILALCFTGLAFAMPDPCVSTASQNGILAPSREPMRDNPADFEVFVEDFENGADDWTTTDFSGHDTTWHKSDYNGAEDNLVWWCGDTLTMYDNDPVGYDNALLQFLDTPILDLSEAGDALNLTFNAWWLLEDPRNVPQWLNGCDGYDGWLVMISTNGGEEFEPLYPEYPAYHGDRLKAAEVMWELGETPGWFFISAELEDFPDENLEERPEVNWIECEFDLSEYHADEIVIRFVLISDGSVAAPYENPYLQESGLCLDNILISDGETDFLVNNADDDPIPEELHAHHGEGEPSGDNWQLTDSDAHTGEWSMWNTAEHHGQYNTLDSPVIEIPEDINTLFQFWIYCNMPDFDSDGNNSLEDFYQVFVSADGGETWEFQFVDYYRETTGAEEWTHYVPGLPYLIEGVDVNVELSLNDYAGEEIQIRWLLRTDNDDEDGVGDGIFLDDIEVLGVDRQPRDAGMANLILPYPNTVGFRTSGFTVEMHNYGTLDLGNIPAFWGFVGEYNDGEFPIVPYRAVDANKFEDIELTDYVNDRITGWTPRQPGVYDVWTETRVGAVTPANPDDDDLAPENDSMGVSNVIVWPANIFELGYDARTIQFAYNFPAGSGPAIRFRNLDADLDNFSIAQIKLLFNGLQEPASFRLHILDDGQAMTPGNELYSAEIEVTPEFTNPNWLTIPLYDVEAVQNLDDRFWVWVEVIGDDNLPQILGDEQLAGLDYTFTFDGENVEDYGNDVMIHAVIVPEPINEPAITAAAEDIDFGEIFIGEASSRIVELYSTGFAPLVIQSVSCDNEAFMVDWQEETTLNFGESIAFEVIFTPQAEGFVQSNLNINCNAEEAPFIALAGNGEVGVPGENSETPNTFSLDTAYPNPFNSTTQINFSLSKAGKASVRLFDLSGREVMTIANGQFTAGANQITLQGDALSAGVYLLSLQAEGKTAARKLALVK